MNCKLYTYQNRRVSKFLRSFAIMSAKRVQHLIPQLKRINRMSDQDKKKFIATCDKTAINCICECVKNLLKGRIPVKSTQLKLLCRHKNKLRELALKKTSLRKRKQILQRGGFIGLLIKPLVLGLSTLVGTLIANARR